ncbi:hypothetical protein ACFLTH_13855 [Bacteroidota bacterium]
MRHIILYIVIFSTNIFAQDFLQQQLDEADLLFNSGKYYDAITEYKRLQFFDDQNIFTYETSYKIALCYKAGAKFDDAVKYFTLAENNTDEYKDIYECKTQIIRANILRRTTDRAHQLLDELEINPRFFYKKMDILYWRGWTYMFADKWEEAAKTFGKIKPDHQLKIIAENVESNKYSITVAKIISFILPGSGQVYTGNYLSGLISFGWNVLFGYLTIDAWNSDRMFDGFAIGSLLWMRFYRGSVQNAERFAIEKNLEIANETLRYLQNSYKGLKP